MSLRDLMADDLVGVLLDEEAFAEPCTYQPQDDSATSFAVVLAVGDVTDQMLAIASGRADQQQISATGSLAVLRAGISAATGVERDPIHGDTVAFASGAYAGTWVVLTVSVDQGGGVVMQLRQETRHEAAARNVAEAR